MSARCRPSSRRRSAAVGILAVSSLAVAAAPAAAETLFDATQSPLIVQGKACVGLDCASGDVPGMALGLKNPDTPGIRLEQTGNGGYTPFTWDVAGNEANFFVRDLTNGSKLPFRIRPGAPTSSLDIAASGNVGIGTSVPTASLDVARADGTARLLVRESSTTTGARTLGELSNNGPVGLRLADTGASSAWQLGTDAASGFALSSTLGGTDRTALRIDPRGTLSAAGALQQAIDPAEQSGVETVDPNAVLEAIEALPIERFSYAGDPSGAEHLSPAGAAFRSALDVGDDDKAIAPGDVATAALAGVRALAARPAGEDERVPTLVADLARLKDGTSAADARLTGLATSFETRFKQLDGRIGAIDARTAEQAKRFAQQTATLTTRVASLRKSRSTMTGRIRKLERAKRAQDRRNASLAATNAALRQRLAKIEAAVAKLK